MAGKNTQERIEAEMERYGLVRIKDHEHHRSTWTALCSCCDNKLEIHQTGSVLVTKQLLEMARARGWRLGYKHAATCPNCLNAIKDKVKREKIAKEVTVNEAPTHTLHQPAFTTEPQTAPITMIGPDPKIARKIYAQLDEHFDETKRRYIGNESDKSIAERIGCSVMIVTKTRDDAYGKLAEDPALAQFAQDYADLKTEVEGMLTAALELFEAGKKDLDARFASITKTHKAAG